MKPYFKKHTLPAIAIALIFTFNGCVKNDDFNFDNVAKGDWSPEFAVPLIYG
jgi:hypothetical protein